MIFHLCRAEVIVAIVQRTSTGGVRFRIVSARHAVHCSRVYVGITPFSVSAGAVLLSRVARLRYDPGRSIKCVRIGLPVSMLGNVGVLSEDRSHEMTFIP